MAPYDRPPGRPEESSSSSMRSKSASRLPSRRAAAPSTSKTGLPSYASSIFTRRKEPQAVPDVDLKDDVATGPAMSRGSEEQARSTLRTPTPLMPPRSQTAPSPSSHFGFRSRSGSTSSPEKKDKPPRNVLRRKPSSINQRSAYTHSDAQTDSTPSLPTMYSASVTRGQTEPIPETSMMGLAMPLKSTSTPVLGIQGRNRAGSNKTPEELPFGIPYQPLANEMPPPTALFIVPTSSPSTRYSESPGPWSRTSTPTSMSSHSPGVVMPSKFPVKSRQISPTRSRPPVTRRRADSFNPDDTLGSLDAQGLPSVRESVTSSSSSGSTMKAGEKGDRRKESSPEIKKRKKKGGLSPPPPSPPPRKSSQRFMKGSAQDESPRGAQQQQNSIPEPPRSLFTGSRLARPPRPSREGAPDLNESFESIPPIIQSQLPTLSSHRRRDSSDAPAMGSRQIASNANAPLLDNVQLKQPLSRLPSRNPSPSPSQTSSFKSASSQPATLGSIPVLKAPDAERSGKKTPVPIGESPSKSRFGLFSRRPKPVVNREVPEITSLKKGPVAGTGHEGYGKYVRGRSGSTTSTGSYARSASTGTAGSASRSVTSRKGSVTSGQEPSVDEFFLERLDPVVIPGGAGPNTHAADMARTGSNQSSVVGRPSTDSKISSSQISEGSKRSNEMSRPTFGFFGAARMSPQLRSTSSSRRPSTSSDETPKKPSLAMRRSLHRSQIFTDKDPLSIPPPIDTNAPFPSPSIGSQETGQYSAVPPTTGSSQMQEDFSEGKEGNWLKPKKVDKRGKSPRKWNFFHRAQTGAAQKTPIPTTPSVTEVAVTVTRNPPPRPVAHYAILDSTDQGSSDNLEDILQEVGDMQDADDLGISFSDPSESRREDIHSVLLPDPPSIPAGLQNSRPASPKVMLRSVEPQQPSANEMLPTKPSRLAQVGRIPRVVSTRNRNQPAPRAFPLVTPKTEEEALTKPAPAPASVPLQTQESNALVHQVHEPRRDAVITSPDIDAEYERAKARIMPTRTYTSDSSTGPFDPNQFLNFPLRKGSEVSYSSSSGGYAATTAIVPPPHAAPGDDEVWNEYDDLIDVLSPAPEPSALGSPFKFTPAKPVPLQLSNSRRPVKESPVVGSDKEGASEHDTTSPEQSSNLLSPPHSGIPTTPMSFTDFFSGYGERNLSVRGSNVTRFSNLSEGSHLSSTSVYSRNESGEKTQYRDTQLMDFADKEREGLDTQMNVRFGALMTSKWLSFGRVLFSPAHTEIKQGAGVGKDDRILILDGLGNGNFLQSSI